MKLLICSFMLISSSSAMAAGIYDRDSGLYTKADFYQQLSHCEGTKIVKDSANVDEGDCADAGKTCDIEAWVFAKTVTTRAICK